RTLDVHIDRVNRCAGAHVQSVAQWAAANEACAGLRQMNLGDKLTGGGVAAYAVLFRGGPAHAAPHVPLHVATHTVGQSRREVVGKDLAVGCRTLVDVRVKGSDM